MASFTSILFRLEEKAIDLLGEVWSFLTLKTLIKLLYVSKDASRLCGQINTVIPREISFRVDEVPPYISDHGDNFRLQGIYLNALLKFVPSMVSLNLRNCSAFGKVVWPLTMLYRSKELQRNLKKLSVCIRNKICFFEIEKLVSLTELDLSGSRICDYDLINIKLLTSLQVLDLSNCASLDRESLDYISEVVNLKKLSLENIYHNTSSDFLCRMLKSLTNLEDLNLKRVEVVDSQVIRVISKHCKKLKVLNLGCCESLGQLDIKLLSESLPHLLELHIPFSYNLPSTSLRYLLDMKSLQYISILGIRVPRDLLIELRKGIKTVDTLEIFII